MALIPVALFAMTLTTQPLAASDGALAAAQRQTVALFTYDVRDGKLLPANQFNGVLSLREGMIVTSSWALDDGLSNPFVRSRRPTRGGPSRVVAVLRDGSDVLIIPCHPTDIALDSPIAVLRIDEAHAEVVAKLAGKSTERRPLKYSPTTRVVGVVAPLGLLPRMLTRDTVAPPLRMSIRFTDPTTVTDRHYKGADVLAGLPRQMAGAGVWGEDGKLMGVVIRSDYGWHVMDLGEVRQLVDPTPTVAAVEEPAMAALPSGGGSTVAAQASAPAAAPRPGNKSVEDILKELKLTRALDEKLIDNVGDETANLVMALIAANKPAEALAKIEEFEQGARGSLSEQLLYRRALAMTLNGQFEEAKVIADRAERARDPLIQARGRLLHKVLVAAPSGTFEGKPLADPDGLVAACLGWLERIKEQADEIYQAAKDLPIPTYIDWLRIDRRFEAALGRIDSYKLSWPGYWDEIEAEILKERADKAAKAPKP